MTENEFWALTPAERRALPRHVADAATTTTLEDGRALLAAEGWEFVGFDDDYDDEDEDDGSPSLDWPPAEVWRRNVGGRVEWCALWYAPACPELPPDQCWHRLCYPFDPRLMEV